jgi:hypothetical protein
MQASNTPIMAQRTLLLCLRPGIYVLSRFKALHPFELGLFSASDKNKLQSDLSRYCNLIAGTQFRVIHPALGCPSILTIVPAQANAARDQSPV